jgi:hypothetical protein
MFLQLNVPIHLSAAVAEGLNAKHSAQKPLDPGRFIIFVELACPMPHFHSVGQVLALAQKNTTLGRW